MSKFRTFYRLQSQANQHQLPSAGITVIDRNAAELTAVLGHLNTAISNRLLVVDLETTRIPPLGK